MGFLMELQEKYQPFIDFVNEHQFSVFLLQGSVDEESNEVMFYFPDIVRGDKDEHKLYIEFSVPNNVIDDVVKYQKQLQNLCIALD